MLIKQLVGILEGKMKQESAADAFARYEKLKKSNADPKMLANVLKIANDLMTYEMKAKIKTLDDKYSGEDWWDTVKTFYKVEERNHEWAVVSDARDWKEEKEWVYPTKYEADEQLYKLITYKVRDRKLGHGSEDKDFERAAVLAKRREPAMAEGLEPKAQAYLDKNGYRTKKTADGLVISNASLNADERSDDGAQEKLKIVADLKKLGVHAKVGGKNNNLVILENLDQKTQSYLDKNGYKTRKTSDGLIISNSSLKADERSDEGSREKLKIVADLKKLGVSAKVGGKNNNLVILESELTEGSWAMASTPEEITKLKTILSKPLRAKNAGKVLYNLIGDDSLLNQIDEVKLTDPEDDVKQMVLIWLKKNVPSLYKAVYHAKVDEGKESLMSEMVRMIPRGYLNEGSAPTFKGYDVSHEEDGVMVLVMGPGDLDNGKHGYHSYSGINVVFGKPGTTPDLVTDDKIADAEVKKYKKEIIAAAEKRLGKKEKEHLASL